jgi:hypothetical protein
LENRSDSEKEIDGVNAKPSDFMEDEVEVLHASLGQFHSALVVGFCFLIGITVYISG